MTSEQAPPGPENIEIIPPPSEAERLAVLQALGLVSDGGTDAVPGAWWAAGLPDADDAEPA